MKWCIVIVKELFFFFASGRFFLFLPSNPPITLYNIRYWWFFFSQSNTLRIPKYGGQNLACWYLHIWSLWTAFTCCCPLSWLLIWLPKEVVNPCLIHCHIYPQNLIFFAFKQLQATLWIIDALFMQNSEFTAFWYFQLLCYLTQPQFTIGQKKFAEFWGDFRNNYRIWVTRAFSIICISTNTFQVSIPPL